MTLTLEQHELQQMLVEAARIGANYAIEDMVCYHLKDACTRLGVSYNTLQKRILEGKIRPGGRAYYRRGTPSVSNPIAQQCLMREGCSKPSPSSDRSIQTFCTGPARQSSWKSSLLRCGGCRGR